MSTCIVNSSRFFAVLIFLVGSNPAMAESFLEKATKLKNALEAASRQSEQVGGTGPQVLVNGDRSLEGELDISSYDSFEKYVTNSHQNVPTGLVLTIKPTYSAFFFPGYKVDFGDRMDYAKSELGQHIRNGNAFGYANAEQMFCYTAMSVFIEAKQNNFRFSASVSKSNSEIINEIFNGHGYVFRRKLNNSAKIKNIDLFGGDLSVQKKHDFLMSLKSKSPQYIESLRFYTDSEANAFFAECYASVGGDLGQDPSELVPPESDYLLSKYPEFRQVVAVRDSEIRLQNANEEARSARARRAQLEQQAKDQEIQLIRLKALEQEKADASAEAEILERKLMEQRKEAEMSAARISEEERKRSAMEALSR